MGNARAKIVVAGANGFTGNWLCRRLAQREFSTRA
jgi:nucleoside-diphosphate-sugar epimerase